MGMFDSVFVAGLVCAVCGNPGRGDRSDLLFEGPEEVEVQFKAFVGRAYSPRLSGVRVGDRLPGFPAIPVLDEVGCWTCRTCDENRDVRVRLERGVVAWVVPMEAEAPPWVGRLPAPRDPERVRRRRATVVEVRRRADAAERKAESLRGVVIPSDWASRLARSMLEPLRRRLDYTAIGRKVFLVEQLGGRRLGPYRKAPGEPWRRVG